MADLTGWAGVFAGDTSIVDTVRQHQLGTRARDIDGNEYVYMQGVASVVAGTWVSYDEAHVTTRLAANAVGRVAVAKAAIDATTDFGWFQIYGNCQDAAAISGGDAAANVAVYATSTAGSVDDVAVIGDLVKGAFFRTQEGEATSGEGYCDVELTYPYVDDETPFDITQD